MGRRSTKISVLVSGDTRELACAIFSDLYTPRNGPVRTQQEHGHLQSRKRICSRRRIKENHLRGQPSLVILTLAAVAFNGLVTG